MADDERILDYSTPLLRRSTIPIFGAIACCVGMICGCAIIAFAAWRIALLGVDGIFPGFQIGLTGALILYLCVSWYRKARRELSRNK